MAVITGGYTLHRQCDLNGPALETHLSRDPGRAWDREGVSGRWGVGGRREKRRGLPAGSKPPAPAQAVLSG